MQLWRLHEDRSELLPASPRAVELLDESFGQLQESGFQVDLFFTKKCQGKTLTDDC